MDFGSFWGAFLGILGILGIIAVAIIVIVIISDLLISLIDGRDGLIIRSRKKTTHVEEDYTVNYTTRSSTTQYDEPVQERITSYDDELARREEQELKGNVYEDFKSYEEETIVEDTFSFNNVKEVPVAENVVSANAYEAQIREINKKAIDAPVDEDAAENEFLALLTQRASTVDETLVEDIDDEVEEIEDDLSDLFEEEEEKHEVTNTDDMMQKLQEQIDELKKQLDDQRKENNDLKEQAKFEREELERMRTESSQTMVEIVSKDGVIYIESLTDLEARLALLEQRLKMNEKAWRLNKKEYIPLFKVRKTLENDKKKLRRKEAIVAKQKVILYGVNNYADIDEEKAKKLNEELDLLEGLRLSVLHCEEVIEANKERFPILESTNKILSETNADIKKDIVEVKEAIEKLKAAQADN